MEIDSKDEVTGATGPIICVQLGDVQISLSESVWNYHSSVIKAMIGDARKRTTVPEGSRLLITLQLKHDPQAFAKLEPLLRPIGTTRRGIPNSKPIPSYKFEEVFLWNGAPDTKLIQCLKELFPLTIDSSKMPQEHLDTFNGKTLIMTVLTILTELRMESIVHVISVYYAILFKQILKLPTIAASGSSASASSSTSGPPAPLVRSTTAAVSSSSVPLPQMAVAPPQVSTTNNATNANNGPAPMDIC